MRVATLRPRRSAGELMSLRPTMPKISLSDDVGASPITLPLCHMAAEGRSPADTKSPRPARNASTAVAPVVKTVTSASTPSSAKYPFALATRNGTQCSSVPLKMRTLASSAAALPAPHHVASAASRRTAARDFHTEAVLYPMDVRRRMTLLPPLWLPSEQSPINTY